VGGLAPINTQNIKEKVVGGARDLGKTGRERGGERKTRGRRSAPKNQGENESQTIRELTKLGSKTENTRIRVFG